MGAGRPAIFETPEQLEAKVNEYMELFNVKQRTVTGLALFLGFESRQSFYDYEGKEEFSYIIKRARLHVEHSYELILRDGNCTGAIFALKNMGWKDKTEVENSGEMAINWNVQKTYEAKLEANEGL